jgi:hypothetical protein
MGLISTKNGAETASPKFWQLMYDEDFVFKYYVDNSEEDRDGKKAKLMEINPVTCRPCDMVSQSCFAVASQMQDNDMSLGLTLIRKNGKGAR